MCVPLCANRSSPARPQALQPRESHRMSARPLRPRPFSPGFETSFPVMKKVLFLPLFLISRTCRNAFITLMFTKLIMYFPQQPIIHILPGKKTSGSPCKRNLDSLHQRKESRGSKIPCVHASAHTFSHNSQKATVSLRP